MATGEIAPSFEESARLALEAERVLLRQHIQILAEEICPPGGIQVGGDSEHEDAASRLTEEELELDLWETERERLAEVEAALDRLTAGRYGLCEHCGGTIRRERLEALPWARCCFACARRFAAHQQPTRRPNLSPRLR